MSQTRIVYNPVDPDDPDPVEVTYRAVVFRLEPNRANEISVPDLPSFKNVNVDMIVGHLMLKHGDRGLMLLTGSPTADEALIEAAEEQYLSWLWTKNKDAFAKHKSEQATASGLGLKPETLSPFLVRIKGIFDRRGKAARSVVNALLVALLSVVGAQAQTAQLAINYDLDATTATSTWFTGTGGSPFGDPIRGPGLLTNAGSSAVVTSVNSAAIFGDLAAGDAIYTPTGTFVSTIVSVDSTSQITLNDAVDLSSPPNGVGYSWSYLQFHSGTTAADGWIGVEDYLDFAVCFYLEQYGGDGNGLDWRVQGRPNQIGSLGSGAGITQIDPDPTSANFNNELAATGVQSPCVQINASPFKEVRIQMLHNTADDGVDTGANKEIINASVTLGERKVRQ